MEELSKRKLALYSGLESKKQRLKSGLFAVEGTKSVSDTLGYYPLEALVIKKGVELPETILHFIPEDKICETSQQGMDKLSSLSTSPDMIAIYHLPECNIKDFAQLPEDLYLMLDGVQDPGNLGTIIRTAHWFGIKRIFASKDTVDIYNPKTIQATMGSLPHVEVLYCNLEEVVTANPSLPVYGLLLEGKNIYKASLEGKGLIVMGNEGKGISPMLRRSVTFPLLIPPYDPDAHGESLNVAIATAVTLSTFRSKV